MPAPSADPDDKGMKTKCFLTVALATIIVSLTAVIPALASASSCAGANSAAKDNAKLRTTILCLHNAERRQHGLRNLRWNRDLSKGAAGHARDMVKRHYFDHHSPGGSDHMDRLAKVGYGSSAARWSAGENLIFSGTSATPQQLFSAWMASADHRRNILRSRWHEFGLGVVATSPTGQAGGITIVALFGTRH